MSEPADPEAPQLAPVQLRLQMGNGSNLTPWYVPDLRFVVAAGLFGLAWKILDMLEAHPEFSTNALFISIATTLLGGGGLGAVVGFCFVAFMKGRNAGPDQGTLP